MNDKNTDNGPDDDRGGGSSYLALIAVIVAIVLLYWFSTVFFDWNKTQTCVGYGGRNCAPRIQMNNQ